MLASFPVTGLGLKTQDIQLVLGMIEKSPVSGLIAPTGSGKTTVMMEAIYRSNARVMVAEPTIPAVQGAARYMSTKLGAGVVGSAAESRVNYDDSHKLIYATAGHVKRKMLGMFRGGKYFSGARPFCDVLVLDEAHLGTLDNDIIMEAWYLAYESGAQVPRLLLVSATLNMGSTPFPEAPSVELQTTKFPVDTQYHTTDVDIDIDTNSLARVVVEILLARDNKNPISPQARGESWLVFCAGQAEVELIRDLINKAARSHLQVIGAYSSSNENENARVFESRADGTRTIIVGTNVMEASITIDDAVFGLDTMREKYLKTTDSGGAQLTTDFVSKSSAMQRLGRVGRTARGEFYRLITEESYEKLEPTRPDELLRVPLHNMMIELLESGFQPENMFSGRIDRQRLRSTMDQLRQLGMVDQFNRPTEIGSFASHLPISVQGSAILWEWLSVRASSGEENSKYEIYPAIILVSMIECYWPSYLFYPKDMRTPRDKIKHFKGKFEELFGSTQDLGVLLRIWSYLQHELIKSPKDPKPHELSKFCAEHSLNHKKIREVKDLSNRLINIFLREGKNIVVQPFKAMEILALVDPVLRKVYAQNILTHVRGGLYKDSNEKEYRLPSTSDMHPEGRKDQVTDDEDRPHQILGIYTVSHTTIGTNRDVRTVSLCYSIPPRPSSRPAIQSSSSRPAIQSSSSRPATRVPRAAPKPFEE